MTLRESIKRGFNLMVKLAPFFIFALVLFILNGRAILAAERAKSPVEGSELSGAIEQKA
jgi:hypothetical protein